MNAQLNYLNQAVTFCRGIDQEVKLEYYASEISEKLGFKSKEAFDNTLSRTLQIFSTLHLSEKKNFKQVFRFRNGEMVIDWKLSALACYLMFLNG